MNARHRFPLKACRERRAHVSAHPNGAMETDTMTSEKTTTDEYFGGCPTCGKNDGYRNAGRSHWFFCTAHKLRWCAGINLFSSWQNETEEEQREKFKLIENYEEVEPIYPDPHHDLVTTAAWHRAQARQHLDMAEEIEREHTLDPIEVGIHAAAAIDRRRNAKARMIVKAKMGALADGVPF